MMDFLQLSAAGSLLIAAIAAQFVALTLAYCWGRHYAWHTNTGQDGSTSEAILSIALFALPVALAIAAGVIGTLPGRDG